MEVSDSGSGSGSWTGDSGPGLGMGDSGASRRTETASEGSLTGWYSYWTAGSGTGSIGRGAG